MDDSVNSNENEKAWQELAITSTVLRRAWEIELATVGLTAPQALVLGFLNVSSKPLTPMGLARLLGREPHTVSALVTRMEADGLVNRTHDLQRKNWVRVSLTKKGKDAFERQLTQRKVRNITECLPKKELDALNVTNGKLRARAIELIREMQPNPYDVLPEW
jgi:DNA-binding MarR family transcriptional regulator